jgi:hypothetical protein
MSFFPVGLTQTLKPILKSPIVLERNVSADIINLSDNCGSRSTPK